MTTMIATKSKQEVKNLKRKRILDSAALLFSQKNYHEVMVDDVARLAKIAKGTVYNYFASKEELYFSIIGQRLEKLISSLKEKIKTESNSIDALHSFVIHLYMFMMKYHDFFLIYQKESLKAENELCAEVSNLDHELKNILVGIIRNGKAEKLFKRN